MKAKMPKKSRSTRKRNTRKKATETVDPNATTTEADWRHMLETFPKRVAPMEDLLLFLYAIAEQHEERATSENRKTEARNMVKQLDGILARTARDFSSIVWHRAMETEDSELLLGGLGDALSGMEKLPALWRHWADIYGDGDLATTNADDSDSFCFWLADSLVEVVKLFEDYCKEYPSGFRCWAAEQPALPMLVYWQKAAYRKRFERLAEGVQLGERCPIHVSKRANYSLETPINAYVFDLLKEFLWAREWIKSANPESILKNEGVTVEEYLARNANIRKDLLPIYQSAAALPRLTKSKTSAQQWADTAIMPYMDATRVDYLNDPQFATIKKRKRVKSQSTARAEIRKDVIRALVCLGWPSSPNPAHA